MVSAALFQGALAAKPAVGYTIYVTPHSHIDLEWYWNYDKTQVICINILRHALDQLKRDPHYAFTQDQLMALKPFWDELAEPDRTFFRRMVREGRFELATGMYVQPENAEADFESLTRQFLFAKPWMEETFNTKVVTAWNLDTFGQTIQMPQLYRRAGLRYNAFMRDPLPAIEKSVKSPFYWQSPDGSKVLSYWLSGSYSAGARNIKQIIRSHVEHNAEGNDKILALWGGDVYLPTENSDQITALVRRAAADISVPVKTVIICTPRRYFEDVEKSGVSLPTYTHDFNPPLLHHDLRGLYAQRPLQKRAERISEDLLESSEKFSSIAGFYGQSYPWDELHWGWERVLFNQNHDTMGASDIDSVYETTMSRFGGALEAGRSALAGALYHLSRKIDTSKGGDYPFIVFNALSFPRTELVHYNILFKEKLRNFRIMDLSGNPIPFRLLSVSRRRPGGPLAMAVVEFVASQVPALGYRLFRIEAIGGDSNAAVWHPSRGEISNGFFALRLDPTTGAIASLVDRQTGQELLDTKRYGGNELVIEEEKNPDMEGMIYLSGKEIASREFATDSIEELRDDLGTRVRIRGGFLGGRRTQEILLYDQLPRIDFRTSLLGFPGHDGMLTAVFPLRDPAAGRNLYETHNAVTERVDNFFGAYTWFDYQYPERGVAILNQGPGAYHTEKGTIKLTLLRSLPNYQGYDSPLAAEAGSHSFSYSLYPHTGNWSQAAVAEQGHSINTPLRAISTDAHAGALAPEHSFLFVESGHFEVTGLKRGEQGKDIILRGIQTRGEKGKVRLKLQLPVERAWRADLLEQISGDVALSRDTVEFEVQPFEFVTLRLQAGRVR